MKIKQWYLVLFVVMGLLSVEAVVPSVPGYTYETNLGQYDYSPSELPTIMSNFLANVDPSIDVPPTAAEFDAIRGLYFAGGSGASVGQITRTKDLVALEPAMKNADKKIMELNPYLTNSYTAASTGTVGMFWPSEKTNDISTVDSSILNRVPHLWNGWQGAGIAQLADFLLTHPEFHNATAATWPAETGLTIYNGTTYLDRARFYLDHMNQVCQFFVQEGSYWAFDTNDPNKPKGWWFSNDVSGLPKLNDHRAAENGFSADPATFDAKQSQYGWGVRPVNRALYLNNLFFYTALGLEKLDAIDGTTTHAATIAEYKEIVRSCNNTLETFSVKVDEGGIKGKSTYFQYFFDGLVNLFNGSSYRLEDPTHLGMDLGALGGMEALDRGKAANDPTRYVSLDYTEHLAGTVFSRVFSYEANVTYNRMYSTTELGRKLKYDSVTGEPEFGDNYQSEQRAPYYNAWLGRYGTREQQIAAMAKLLETYDEKLRTATGSYEWDKYQKSSLPSYRFVFPFEIYKLKKTIAENPATPSPASGNHHPTFDELRDIELPETLSKGTVVGKITAQDVDPGQTLRYWIIGGNLGYGLSMVPETGELKVSDYWTLKRSISDNYSLKVMVTDDGVPMGYSVTNIPIRLLASAPATVELEVESAANGSVIPSGPRTLNYGASVNLEAQAAPGYVFDSWEVVFGHVDFANRDAAHTAVSAEVNSVIRAHFVPWSGNVPPSPQAGDAQVVFDMDRSGDESVTLDGSASWDNDGTIPSYVWTKGGTQIATGVSPSVSLSLGTHAIMLTVTDDQGATAVDVVNITVVEKRPDGLLVHYDFEEGLGGSGTQIVDQSGNGHHATVNRWSFLFGSGHRTGGNVEWVAGPSSIGGTALDLNESTVEIDQPLDVFDQISDAMTIAMWFKYEGKSYYSSSSAPYLFQARENTSSNKETVYGKYSTGEGKTDLGKYINSGGIVKQDEWVHLTFTIDKTAGKAQVYTNGVLVSDVTTSSGPNIVSNEIFTIGGNKSYDSASSSYSYWYTNPGEIDDFRIYNQALNANDIRIITSPSGQNFPPVADAGAEQVVIDVDGSGVEDVVLDASGSKDKEGAIASYVWMNGSTQIATGVNPSVSLGVGMHTLSVIVTDDAGAASIDTVTITVSSSGTGGPTGPAPVAWYKLDETSGMSAADSSGNGHTGTANRDIILAGAAGKYDTAASFRGGSNDDYIDTNGNVGSTDDFTATFWAYPTQMAHQVPLDKMHNSDTNNVIEGWEVRLRSDGKVRFNIGDGELAYGDIAHVETPSTAYALNTWVHVAVSFESATETAKIYIDGTLVKAQSGVTQRPGNTTIPLRIGRRNVTSAAGDRFGGELDDIRIFHQVLSDAEIIAVMNNSTGPMIDTTTDSDSDGVTDFLEDAFGTDPNDGVDRPDLLGDFLPKTTGDVDYQVRNMTDGYTYELQTSTNLVTGAWETEQTFVGSGGPSTVTIDQSKASADGTLFIRIKVSK